MKSPGHWTLDVIYIHCTPNSMSMSLASLAYPPCTSTARLSTALTPGLYHDGAPHETVLTSATRLSGIPFRFLELTVNFKSGRITCLALLLANIVYFKFDEIVGAGLMSSDQIRFGAEPVTKQIYSRLSYLFSNPVDT